MNAAETGQNDSAAMAQTIYTEDSRVACDGGGGALGHPQVWLTLGSDGQVRCPYCSRLFVATTSPSED
jgi:uncharacterized Zn-finger protein